MRTKIKKIIYDPLYKNSFFIGVNTLLGSIAGFVFWVVVSRYYSVSEVGLATAIFSAMTLLSTLAVLGFDIGLIRYLPNEDYKKEMVNSCLTTSAFFSILISVIFILAVNFLMPSLSILHENVFFSIIFILSVVVYCIISVQNSVFISLRKAKLSFYHSFNWAVLKIIFAILFVHFGVLGLFSSWLAAMSISLIFGVYLCMTIIPNYTLEISTYKRIEKIMYFTVGNHISRFLGSAPGLILPILIVNVLASENAAYFYISWMIAGIILMLNSSIITSFFVECSHDKLNVTKHLFKSLGMVILLSVISIVSIFLFGEKVLLLFNKDYSENSIGLLKILAISCIPYSINEFYIVLERLNENISNVILVNLFITSVTLSLSYFAMIKIGLIGVGYSWLIGNVIMNIYILFATIYKKHIKSENEGVVYNV